MDYLYEAKEILKMYVSTYDDVDIKKLSAKLKQITQKEVQKVYMKMGYNAKRKREK